MKNRNIGWGVGFLALGSVLNLFPWLGWVVAGGAMVFGGCLLAGWATFSINFED